MTAPSDSPAALSYMAVIKESNMVATIGKERMILAPIQLHREHQTDTTLDEKKLMLMTCHFMY